MILYVTQLKQNVATYSILILGYLQSVKSTAIHSIKDFTAQNPTHYHIQLTPLFYTIDTWSVINQHTTITILSHNITSLLQYSYNPTLD